VIERLNGEDGLGAIYPAMANSVMMFDLLGYPEDHPARAIARKSVENLLVIHEDEAYCQPCVSPVWDTALAAHAMLEAGGETNVARAGRARLPSRCRCSTSKATGPRNAPACVRGLGVPVQQRPLPRPRRHRRGRDGDGSRPGRGPHADRPRSRMDGRAAVEERRLGRFRRRQHVRLPQQPFADHGALLDPPTADVSARCISMLAQLGRSGTAHRMAAAIEYLRKEQGPSSWFGRWGVNYIYGTWSVLCALNAAGIAPATRWSRARFHGCARSRTPTAAGARIAAMRSTARAISGALHCRRPPGRCWR
jgi:squalene-hopene/tetraprenyl-beta-curcumene cyclase